MSYMINSYMNVIFSAMISLTLVPSLAYQKWSWKGRGIYFLWCLDWVHQSGPRGIKVVLINMKQKSNRCMILKCVCGYKTWWTRDVVSIYSMLKCLELSVDLLTRLKFMNFVALIVLFLFLLILREIAWFPFFQPVSAVSLDGHF